ncbi:MAG: ABC transporter substrate-binding protein [Actinobacteria bacterium]|nr:ABC transporter substrate-binding protein [Actinomycetota bacterium]
MHRHARRTSLTVVLATALAAGLMLAGGSAAGQEQREQKFAGFVNVGISTTLSGSIATLGQGGLQGVQLAVDEINAKGGLLRKKVNIVSADDAASPATGAANVRTMILDKKISALFGPVTSSAAAAELQLTAEYKVPTFLHTSNDVSLMTKRFTPYAFQLVPNTVMEPRAVAAFLATKVGSRKLRIATFAPDYVFGRTTVANFLAALKDLNVNFDLVDQQWPALGAPNIAPQLSSLISSKPELTFNVQFGGDLVNFTNQAAGYGFFKNTRIIAMYSYDPLQALAGRAPAGGIAYSRAPFWAIKTPEMAAFVTRYRAKYKQWPSEWAILAYTSVQSWSWAVQKTKSLNADKVTRALAGATVPTIRGPVTLRACDHQAVVPHYVGTIAKNKDSRVGFPLWSPIVYTAPASKIMLTCAESAKLRQS